MRVVFDMDGVFVDLLGAWLKRINTAYKTKIKDTDVKTWNLQESAKFKQLRIDKKKVYDQLTKEVFEEARPYHNAHAYLRQLEKDLAQDGHELFVLTRPSDSGSLIAKNEWIKKHVSLEFEKRMVYAHHKHAFRGDVFLDDHPETCIEYLKHNPGSLILVPEHSYNSTPKVKAAFKAANHLAGITNPRSDLSGILQIASPKSVNMWWDITNLIAERADEKQREYVDLFNTRMILSWTI